MEHSHSHQCLLHRPHHHYHHRYLLIFHPPLSPPPPHHHHHHHHHHHCHNHHHHYLISPLPPQNTQPEVSLPPSSNHTTLVNEYVAEVEEEGEDEDPVFVMTDEWKEFFAKSEAKRREAKKLAKKQGKK